MQSLRASRAFTLSNMPVKALLIAGLLGQISFELYAWILSPLLFGLTLEPANLVMGLTRQLTGLTLSYPVAFALHTLIGAAFVLLVWALHTIFAIRLLVAGALAGFALWFIAQGVLAPAVGRSFMMGFGAYTQSSFLAHVGMTLVMAALLKAALKD